MNPPPGIPGFRGRGPRGGRGGRFGNTSSSAGAGGFSGTGPQFQDDALGPLNEAWKFFVASLPLHATCRDLRDHFSVFGIVNFVKLIAHKDTGKSAGYGFVYMADAVSDKAVEDYANSSGNRITILGQPRVFIKRNEPERAKPLRNKQSHDEDKVVIHDPNTPSVLNTDPNSFLSGGSGFGDAGRGLHVSQASPYQPQPLRQPLLGSAYQPQQQQPAAASISYQPAQQQQQQQQPSYYGDSSASNAYNPSAGSFSQYSNSYGTDSSTAVAYNSSITAGSNDVNSYQGVATQASTSGGVPGVGVGGYNTQQNQPGAAYSNFSTASTGNSYYGGAGGSNFAGGGLDTSYYAPAGSTSVGANNNVYAASDGVTGSLNNNNAMGLYTGANAESVQQQTQSGLLSSYGIDSYNAGTASNVNSTAYYGATTSYGSNVDVNSANLQPAPQYYGNQQPQQGGVGIQTAASYSGGNDAGSLQQSLNMNGAPLNYSSYQQQPQQQNYSNPTSQVNAYDNRQTQQPLLSNQMPQTSQGYQQQHLPVTGAPMSLPPSLPRVGAPRGGRGMQRAGAPGRGGPGRVYLGGGGRGGNVTGRGPNSGPGRGRGGRGFQPKDQRRNWPY